MPEIGAIAMIPLGVLYMNDAFSGTELLAYTRELEQLGYDSLWLPELYGREPVATAGYLLGQTERIKLATGIANIYVRDAHATAQIGQTLAELSAGRFILGLGVSNVGLNTSRGHEWQAPLGKMTRYLDAMAAVKVASPQASTAAPLYLAAHGPRLQALASERADGIITYLMSPQHTLQSRQRIGPDAALNVVCVFLAEADPDTARAKARAALNYYLTLDYYHREWRKLGYTDADFSNGGSDKLIDMLVGWGDAAALRRRVAEHEQTGATRVIVMSLDAPKTAFDDSGVFKTLAGPG